MADIFISYSTSDKSFTERLYRELERFNVHGFMDTSDLAAGSEWTTHLRETVRNADAVLVILSKSAARSNWVLALNEVRSRARRRQKILIFIATLFALLSMLSAMLAFYARQQAKVAELARAEGEVARAEAEARRTRLEHLTGQSGAMAIAPDGNTFATGSQAGEVALWEGKSGRLLTILKGHQGVTSALAFSPDGRALAVAGWDGTVTIWDVVTKEVLRHLGGYTAAVIAVQFSPDGRVLYSRSVDGDIREWSVSDGALLRTFLAPP